VRRLCHCKRLVLSLGATSSPGQKAGRGPVFDGKKDNPNLEPGIAGLRRGEPSAKARLTRGQGNTRIRSGLVRSKMKEG